MYYQFSESLDSSFNFNDKKSIPTIRIESGQRQVLMRSYLNARVTKSDKTFRAA